MAVRGGCAVVLLGKLFSGCGVLHALLSRCDMNEKEVFGLEFFCWVGCWVGSWDLWWGLAISLIVHDRGQRIEIKMKRR